MSIKMFNIGKTKLISKLPLGFVSRCASATSDPDWVPNDVKTHTGQQFDKDDYRNARFVLTQSPKQVNSQWAINLIEQVPPKEVDKRVVWCDGGDGPVGHPRIFINLDQPGNHSCTYCGLRFVKKQHH